MPNSNHSVARKLLVTCALPYANGPIHLGHLLEYIQADIWVRHHRLHNHECYFVCADDAHGTAIMLKAEELNISPETLIANSQQEHLNSFTQFHISFDHYHSTHSPENQALAEFIFQKLQGQGYIISKSIEQLFDPEKKLFLADRFVQGTCPKCHASNQNGDNCDVCGATYDATELIDPVSRLSDTQPILKTTEQLYFNMADFTDFLSEWTRSGALQSEVANKLSEWLDCGLTPWDISRQAPYFGFAIPNHPDKFFYVWLDAPIGYMASFKAFCEQQGAHPQFEEYWQQQNAEDSGTELYHFIGKDIINFHGLFWPAMLKTAKFRLPTNIFVHGFVTVNGEKMSKSKGTFIKADTYLECFPPEFLRYYFACKINPNVEDHDLNLEDFQQRVNSDLVGKYVNLASRCAGFLHKLFEAQLSDTLPDEALYQQFQQAADTVHNYYDSHEYGKCMRLIMQLADLANQYIDQQAPWKKAKNPEELACVQDICTQGLNLFRTLSVYLKPVLPSTIQKVESFLAIDPLTWQDSQTPLLAHKINAFKPLMQRITPEQLVTLTSSP